MSDPIYCGNANEIQTAHGKLMKLSISAKDIETMSANLNNGWVNVDVKGKRNPAEGKPTHYLQVNDWKPENANRNEPQAEVNVNVDDKPLPF